MYVLHSKIEAAEAEKCEVEEVDIRKNALQCNAACAECYSLLQCVAVCCSVLQCKSE